MSASKRIVGLFLAALFFGAVLPEFSAGDQSALYAFNLASGIVFPLYSELNERTGRACTGFYLAPARVERDVVLSAWAITAGHCALNGATLRMATPSWWLAAGIGVIGGAKVSDSAILLVSERRPKPYFLPLADAPQVDDLLVIVGYGAGTVRGSPSVLRASSCVYTGPTPTGHHMRCGESQYDGIRNGMSGSPVVTWDGKIAGILVRGTFYGNQAEYVDIHRAIAIGKAAIPYFPGLVPGELE